MPICRPSTLLTYCLLCVGAAVSCAQTPPSPAKAKKVTLSELNSFIHKDQWVSIEAYIWTWRYNKPTLELRLNTREGWSSALIHLENPAEIPGKLQGAKARITGLNSGSSAYTALSVPSLAQVEILEPGGDDPFDIPLVPFEDVARRRIEWGRRVKIKGTLAGLSEKANLLVTQGTIGLTCQLTFGWTPFFGKTEIRGDAGTVPQLTNGDVVEVVGSLVEKDHNTSLLPLDLSYCHVRVVGKSPVPEPQSVDISHLAKFKEHSEWVSIEGTVDAWTSDGAGNLSLGLLDHRTAAAFTVRDAANMPFPEDLFGARVRLTGMTRAMLPGAAYNLVIPSPRNMQVLRPGTKSAFGAPERPLNDVARRATPPAERVRVRGVLIARPLSEVLHVRGQDAAISVKLTRPWGRGSNPAARYADGGPWPTKLTVGDEVEIVGHPMPDVEDARYQPYDLVSASVRVVQSSTSPPAPRNAALDDIIDGYFTADFVETRGRLVSFDQTPAEQGYWRTSLLLESAAGALFPAVSYSQKPPSTKTLRVDDDLLLRALVSRATSLAPRQLWFSSTAEDVKSLGVSPVVLTRQLWRWGGGGAAVLLLLGGWITHLRRTNHRQKLAAAALQIANDAARESEQRWKLLFEQSPLSVQIFSPDGQTKRFNHAWKSLFRLNDEQGYAFNVLEAPDLIASGAVEHIRKAFRGEVVHVPPVPYPVPGDPPETRWIGGVLYPVKNAAGEIIEVVTVHNDITESKRAAEALMEINQNLEKRVAERTIELEKAHADLHRALAQERELGELKSRFVTMVSHEFRTPLGIIMSAIELMRHYEDKLPKEQLAELQTDIFSATRHMAGLMEQVLVLGRVEAGKLGCKRTPCDLDVLADKLTDESLSATHRKCPILWLPKGDLTGAMADEALLRHIFSNLLTNAVKYSPDGSEVLFTARREGDDVVFEVTDHGIGIPESDRERLFEAFHRCSNVGEIPGTGLGLVIVKRCVDLHGGTLEITSEVGKGTTFSVRLPLFAK